jgi:Flp pilus assembly protein TadD
MPVPDLIAAYQQGDQATVERGLSGVNDLEQFGKRLISDTWSLRMSASALFEPRLLVAGALALEAVQLQGLTDRRKAAVLVEAGCNIVRLNLEKQPVERLWHHVAISLLEGLGDPAAIDAHAVHALRRFPDEPAFVLARAVAAEMRTYPDDRHIRVDKQSPQSYRAALERMETARALDDSRAEATMRLGSLLWRAGQPGQAVDHLREAASLAREPDLQYLSSLLLGRALEADGRLDQAASAYHAATIALSGAQTAEIALAAALSRLGQRADAGRVAGDAVRSGARPSDPWLVYGQGDLRRLPTLLVQLREALR